MSKEKVCNKNCPHYYNGQCFKEAKSYKDGYDDGIREERQKAYKIGYNDGYERGKAECVSAERVGEWKIDEYGIYHCPFCHAINNTVYKSFCPNCGARMTPYKGGDDK